MRFDVVSIFPDELRAPLAIGVVGRAQAENRIDVHLHDLRDYADPPHRRVDDEAFGGGAGMVYKPEPMVRAIGALRRPGVASAVVLPSPRGERLTQALVEELAEYQQLLLLCDRYEGSDGRIAEFVTHEVSVGDFVLTGGELPALMIVDAVARLGADVVGCSDSVERDSFQGLLLDHGSWTRPARYRGRDVPSVLRNGNHRCIDDWRGRDALRQSLERRPDRLRPARPALLRQVQTFRTTEA